MQRQAGTVRNMQRGGLHASPLSVLTKEELLGKEMRFKSNGLNPTPKGLKLPDDAASEGPNPQRVKSPAAELTRG